MCKIVLIFKVCFCNLVCVCGLTITYIVVWGSMVAHWVALMPHLSHMVNPELRLLYV